MSLLDARGITKSYRNGDEETLVLKGIDMTLEPGEMIAMLGPSGSGKSTLLNILGLLMRPSSGSLSLLGRPLAGQSDRALSAFRNAHLGFVFQFHHLLPDFTALENVAFPAAAPAGGTSRAIRERAAHLLDRVGLSDRAHYLATRLSGGQKQRVAIARALINRPDLVLADEPTGNLDRDNSHAVMALLRDINVHESTTFLISTHDPDIAARCDRRIHVVDGRLADG
jgi:lipoprotein-releasing system ATP-binding protein